MTDELTDIYLQIEKLAQMIGTLESRLREAEAPKVDKRANAKKLTRQEVSMIRRMNRDGLSQREIADIYEVNPATISRIVRGIYFK